jgi:hypothetical protein
MRLFYGLLGAAALFIAGCAGPRGTVAPTEDRSEGFPYHSAEEIVALIADDSAQLHAFSARGSLTLQSPQQRGTFSTTIRNRRADSLYLSAGQFGFEGLRALATPDSFYVYDLLRNRITYGDIGLAGSTLPIPVDGDSVFESLLGIIVPDANASWQVSASGQYYTLSDPQRRRTLVVDPTIWRVIRYEERSPSGDLLEERLYADFSETDGVVLPGRVTFNVPPQDTRVTLVYRSLDLNPDVLSFDIRASSSAQRIPAGVN